MHGFHHVANGCDAFNRLLFSDYRPQSTNLNLLIQTPSLPRSRLSMNSNPQFSVCVILAR
jgi:hypothetical protein